MLVSVLLEGLCFEGKISIRRSGKGWFEYLAFGYSKNLIKRHGCYFVLRSCIIDEHLILYVY